MFTGYNVEAIAAIDQDFGLSKHGDIPWYYPEDFKWFKRITSECIGIMGRGTYIDINRRMGVKGVESVLPGRRIYVLTNTLKDLPNATVVTSLEQVEEDLFKNHISKERTIFFLGGSEVYKLGIPMCKRLYITKLYNRYGCDQFFPFDMIDSAFDITFFDDRPPDLCFTTFSRKVR